MIARGRRSAATTRIPARLPRAAAHALLLAGLGGAGCGFFDAGPPDRSCRADRDCFRAQGERCNPETRQCEVPVDAGIDAAPPVDAELDATLSPAGEPR